MRHHPRGWAAMLFGATLLAGCSAPSPSHSPPPSRAAASSATASPIVTPTRSSPATPRPTPTAAPTPPGQLAVQRVAQGLRDPVGIANAGDGSGRLFVIERSGAIRVIDADGALLARPFVDLSARVLAGGERGLLGLAFHPDFAANGRLFVDYTRAGDGATVIAELTADAAHQRAAVSSERVLLTVTQPYANHNGGQLAFGPDGDLYIGLGDGGSGGDPLGNGQNTGVLLGKILRIDVDGPAAGGRPYAIPAGNPFAAGGTSPGGGLPEIWALGLRNPWRFSFDSGTGDLYIGDVGQNAWEEVDRQPASSTGGEDYGWNVMEGLHCYRSGCDPDGYVKPIAEYGHDQGRCAVSGGYVYRGSRYPAMDGLYIFGDYCAGTILTLSAGAASATPRPVLESGFAISSFGVNEAGELFVAAVNEGAVYHLLPG